MATNTEPIPGLEEMRARIVASGVRTAALVGVVAYVPSVVASIVGGVWPIAVVDTLLYAWILFVRFGPLRDEQRALHLVLVTHALGAMLVFALGPFGHGVMWQVGATVLAGLLIGRRAALRSILCQAIVIGGATIVLVVAAPAVWFAPINADGALVGWLAFAGSSLFLASALSMPLAKLLTNLQETLAKLRDERARLADANARIIADADHRRRLEAQLHEARKLEAMGRMAGGIAHDFGNLLTPILAYATAARSALPEDSQAGHDLDEVLGSTVRARDLVQRLVAFCRREAVKRTPIDVGQIVLGMQSLMQTVVSSALRTSITVDPAAVDARVEGNTVELERVLLNLATNAAYAMRERGTSLTVHVGLAAVADAPAVAVDAGHGFVRIDVSDDGSGMDEETRLRIFDPFFTTKADGTGLGLATVHSIVTSMSGGIVVTSAPGTGTTFSIFLPRLPTSSSVRSHQPTEDERSVLVEPRA